MEQIYDEQVGNVRINNYLQQKEKDFLKKFLNNTKGCSKMKIIEALRNEDGKIMIVSVDVEGTRKLLSECEVEELDPIFKDIELIEDGTEYKMFKLDAVEVSNIIFNEIETHLFGCSEAYLRVESRIKDIILSSKSITTVEMQKGQISGNNVAHINNTVPHIEDNKPNINTEFKFDPSTLPKTNKMCSELGVIGINKVVQFHPSIDEDTFTHLFNMIKDKYGLQLKVTENTRVTNGLSDGEFSNYVQHYILEKVIERLNEIENTNFKIVTIPKPNTVESNLSFDSPTFN